MGYERKLYVVSEWDRSELADVIATVDISKIDYNTFSGLFDHDADKDIYILESNDDMKVTEDKYGEHIKSEHPENVLNALVEDYRTSHYWREKIAIDLISSVIENDTELFEDERIMIYSYGY